MADWKDTLRRVKHPDGRELIGASFRGVSFFVEAAQLSGGKRLVRHRFPYRKGAFVEELGVDEHSLPIDGYVIGDDFLAQKDKLIAALEEEGAGTLVHPYEGTLKAFCEKFNVRHVKSEGRIATFSLEFVDASTQTPAPAQVEDAAAQVSSAADVAITATDAEFQEKFDVEDLPSFALESAEVALLNASAELEARLSPLVTATQVTATQELAELKSKLTIITARASSLVRTPADVLGSFRDVIGGLVGTIEAAPGAVMLALIQAYFVDLGAVVAATTSTREREASNQAALTAAIRRVLAIEAARLAPLVSYTSTDEALAARDTLGAILDEEAEAADDTAYPAIAEIRAAVLRHVPGTQTLASVVTITQQAPVPTLLLAYKLYGSVKLADDIAARNGVAHPGFVSGDLKVLSNG